MPGRKVSLTVSINTRRRDRQVNSRTVEYKTWFLYLKRAKAGMILRILFVGVIEVLEVIVAFPLLMS